MAIVFAIKVAQSTVNQLIAFLSLAKKGPVDPNAKFANLYERKSMFCPRRNEIELLRERKRRMAANLRAA